MPLAEVDMREEDVPTLEPSYSSSKSITLEPMRASNDPLASVEIEAGVSWYPVRCVETRPLLSSSPPRASETPASTSPIPVIANSITTSFLIA